MISRLSEAVATSQVVFGGPAPYAGAVVLAYHDVRPDAVGYDVTPSRLRRQLELVASAGLRFATAGDLVHRLARGEQADGIAVVTFDDALAGLARHATPILEDLGVPATVFAVSDRLGTRADWWTGDHHHHQTVSTSELVAISDDGPFTVGSHTRSHPSLPVLGDLALADELDGSRRRLEDLTGAPVDLLAYPSGHHDARVRAAAATAGFRAGFTFLNGRCRPELDRFQLPRFTMGSHHHRVRLAHHLARSADGWPDTQLDQVTATVQEPVAASTTPERD